jgi:CheY-like chemotaxis protein
MSMIPVTALHCQAGSNHKGTVGGYDPRKRDESSGPVQILVVEDDPVMREMVVSYLEEHNMRAVGASGREEMASHLASGEPSLVLLDLSLGRDNGLDLLRETRARSDVPVIIITGDRRDEIDGYWGSSSVPMTTSSSRSVFASFWHECGPCCGGGRVGAFRRRGMRRAAAADSAAGSSIGAAASSPTPTAPRSR